MTATEAWYLLDRTFWQLLDNWKHVDTYFENVIHVPLSTQLKTGQRESALFCCLLRVCVALKNHSQKCQKPSNCVINHFCQFNCRLNNPKEMDMAPATCHRSLEEYVRPNLIACFTVNKYTMKSRKWQPLVLIHQRELKCSKQFKWSNCWLTMQWEIAWHANE